MNSQSATTKYEQALDLLISGTKTLTEVLAMFPDLSANELEELSTLAQQLKTTAQQTQPNSAILEKLLTELPTTSVTKNKSLRYINEQEVISPKGRSFFNKLFNLNFMNKQTYLATGVIVLIIAVFFGVYTFWPSKTADNNIDLAYVTDNLDQDMNDLDALVNNQALAGVDADLTALANSDNADVPHEDIPFEDNTTQGNVDVSDLDNFADELGSDLDALTSDLSDLSAAANDDSLSGLDNSLSSF